MDYTLSNGFHTHTGTGQRMHREAQAIPTALGDKDLNQTIWSLMEVVKAGGGAGVQFDPDVPSTYQGLLNAIRAIIQGASSDLPGRIAFFLQPTPPAGWMKANGALLSRTVYPELWAHVQTVGAVSEADWADSRWGWFSSGDGSTTFRIPDLRSAFLRPLDDGRGIDAGRIQGSGQQSSNLAHGHAVTDAGHSHGTTDLGHGHTINDPGHAHNSQYGNSTPGSLDTDNPGGLEIGDLGPNRTYGTTTSTTGITLQSSLTGLGIQVGTTGIVIQSSGTSEAKPFNVALPVYIRYA